MSEREQLMCKLSGARFAAFEMQLFLDTHAGNSEALKQMQKYQEQAAGLQEEYERKYGPITADDIYGDSRYDWICAPWPWDTEREAK